MTMPETMTEQPSLTAPNGHFRDKSGGKTLYDGPLANLPAPQRLTPEEAAARMHSDGYVLFPAVLDRAEVVALRALMDEKGGPDDDKWVVQNWCYNRHQATDYWQDPRLLTYIDRPASLTSSGPSTTPARTSPAAASGRPARDARWASTWTTCR